MGFSPQAALRAVDDFQQKHRFIAFPVAVWKKFSDDEAGNLAALVAYFAFVSVFPLLLVLITVLGIALRNNPALQQRVLNSALTEFPVIGQQLRANVHSLNRTGVGLAVGVIGTLLGARGVSGAVQNAMNTVWEVPRHQRPGFPFSLLRSLGIIGVVGVGVLATTALSGLGTWGGRVLGGAPGSVAAIAVSLVVNVALFWLGLRIATAPSVRSRDLRLGAILAAIVWQILQTLGVYFVTHSLRHASSLYGTFGLVLGLVAWLYLQAQLTLYAVEADVVRARGLWPRSLFPPPHTAEDRKAYAQYRDADSRQPQPQPPPQQPEGADAATGDGTD
jgi:YihY family inner membrane protein